MLKQHLYHHFPECVGAPPPVPPVLFIYVLFMIYDVLSIDCFFSSSPLRSSYLKLFFPPQIVNSKLQFWMLVIPVHFRLCAAGFIHWNTTGAAAKFNTMVENKPHPVESFGCFGEKRINKSKKNYTLCPPRPPPRLFLSFTFCRAALLGCQCCRCCISVQAPHNGNHKRNGILLCAIDLFL